MNEFDEPSSVVSTRKQRGKKAVEISQSEEQEPSQTEFAETADEPTVAPEVFVDPVVVYGVFQDTHGNEMGDDVFYWLGADHNDMLIPHPAKLCDLMSDGAWKGVRFRPIPQGLYAIQVMRYSETPRHGYFTKKKK
jgi:hypothetical protein